MRTYHGDDMGSKRHALLIPDVLNPLPAKDDGTDKYVRGWLDGHTWDWCVENARWRVEMLRVAYKVLHEPGRITEAKRNVKGVETVGYCYTGRPGLIPSKAGLAMRPLASWEVVVAFLDMEFRLWEWGVEDCDDDDDLMPKDDDGDRYGEIFFPLED